MQLALGVDCVFANVFGIWFCSSVAALQYVDCSGFSEAQLPLASEGGYLGVLDLYGVAFGEGVCFFVPEAEFDFSCFVRYPGVGHGGGVSVARVDC